MHREVAVACHAAAAPSTVQWVATSLAEVVRMRLEFLRVYGRERGGAEWRATYLRTAAHAARSCRNMREKAPTAQQRAVADYLFEVAVQAAIAADDAARFAAKGGR